MSEAEMQVPDPKGHLSGHLVTPSPGASPEEQAGAEGDPRKPPFQEPWVVVTKPGGLPPAKKPGSRANSNVDEMSNDNIVQRLQSIFVAVRKFQDPAAKEFLKARAREVDAFSCFLQEKEKEANKVAQLKDANQRLQQELQEAKRSQRTDFHIQVRVAGETGGCEKQFLKKVSDHLSDHHINLKAESYREGSGHFLLVFCLVGSGIANALEGLGSEPKAVLVMLHPIPKECNHFRCTGLQTEHPAVVCTVHARYTTEEGFYTCRVNEEAMAIVAKVLEVHCKGGKGDPAIPGAPSKSQNP